MKNVEFCRKTSKFLPFIFCIFYLNEKELNQQVCLIKYAEKGISNSTSPSPPKKMSKNIIQLFIIIKILKLLKKLH